MSFIAPHKIFSSANSDGDAIITSLLDCDVYKPIMGQFIWHEGKQDAIVTFKLKIRTPGLLLGLVVPEAALREQIDSLLGLRLSETEQAQLHGMTVDQADRTKRHLFAPAFVDFLSKEIFKDVTYKLVYLPDGTVDLEITGRWVAVMFIETPLMAIISELYYWHLWQKHGISQAAFSSFYAQMYQRIVDDCKLLQTRPDLTFSQFGHRRRHSRMWEVVVQEVFLEMLPNQCMAPSNMWLAFKMGQNNPKGTNAHELPMVWATFNENTDDWIKESPYDVVTRWNKFYPELAILLPDTYRSSAFFAGAPEGMAADVIGVRLDSKAEEKAIPEAAQWFVDGGQDPYSKLYIPSDGLTAKRMVKLDKLFRSTKTPYPVWKGRKSTFGYGTQGTNQVNGILPESTGFHTISMVIKAVKANGVATVKLSDNPKKHTGIEPAQIDRYDTLFLKDGEEEQETIV